MVKVEIPMYTKYVQNRFLFTCILVLAMVQGILCYPGGKEGDFQDPSASVAPSPTFVNTPYNSKTSIIATTWMATPIPTSAPTYSNNNSESHPGIPLWSMIGIGLSCFALFSGCFVAVLKRWGKNNTNRSYGNPPVQVEMGSERLESYEEAITPYQQPPPAYSYEVKHFETVVLRSVGRQPEYPNYTGYTVFGQNSNNSR
ncbi:hypothetical protein K7432_011646 [Basidiobolus ranarum]|uniref:Uncharacterized protein n=1 Tax=Basidiobolus ranarum TaxID=34480 RepID=A0ABR2WLX7_9FUNG